MQYKPETPQWMTWVKSSGRDTFRPHVLFPWAFHNRVTDGNHCVVRWNSYEVQSILPKSRFHVYNSDVKSIPVICVYQDLKVPLVTASVVFEDPSALTKKHINVALSGSCFSTCSFNKHAKPKSTKSQGIEYILMGAETEQTSEASS